MPEDQVLMWLDARGTERFAIAQARHADDVASAIVAWQRSDITLVAKRPLCDAVAMNALLDGVTKPRIVVSRGLVKDLVQAETLGQDEAVVIQSRVALDQLTDDFRRMAQTLRMLAGYDIEPSIWEEPALRQVTGRLTTFAGRRPGKVLLADSVASPFLVRLWPDARQLTFPSTQRSNPAAEAYPDPTVQAEVPPTLDIVAAHGRFLATTDRAALLAMHKGIASTAFAEVFSVWRDNLELAARQPANDGAAAAGLLRLDDIQRQLSATAR